MRILSIGNFSTGWDGSICDEEHIAGALEELGHEVVRIQRETLSERGNIFTEGCDFTLIAQWDGYGFLDNLPHPLVYWAFDYQEDSQEWHERLIRECDVYLSKPLSDAKKHKNWRWLSQDFAPSFLDKWEEPTNVEKYEQAPLEKDIEVLFTGSWVPWESGQERVKVLKAIDEKYDLHIYGVTPEQWRSEGFKNVHGPVMDHDLPALIARAKVNFSMDHVWAPGYWSDRNAQIMCCGGFVLFRHVPLSEAIFHNKIAYFTTQEEALKGIEHYLYADEDRELIAAEGYEDAQDRMTVHDRVVDLLTIVGEFL